jgi:DNA-binding response OmpR family regulator
MNPKVLIVDDDTECIELVEYNLRQQGCEVVVAQNGIQALRLAQAELPDAVVLDLMLPDLDGLSVCEILNSQPSTRDIPVFILSALDETWAKTRRSRARVARYFRKPADFKALAKSIQAAWKERQALIRSQVMEPNPAIR